MLAETKADDKISEDLVKTWTGNDPLKIRKLFAEEQEVETHAKLVIQTNNKPGFSGEQALQDRIHLTNFAARFTAKGDCPGETKADPELVRKLQEDYLHEVFVWMLNGSVNWYKNRRLDMPTSVHNETQKYFEENDIVAQWLACNTTGGGKTPRAQLYTNFQSWCGLNTEIACSAKEFYALLVMKKYSICRGGTRLVHGLQLKSSPGNLLKKALPSSQVDPSQKLLA